MRTLADTGELGRTLVVFTSDNGYFLGEQRMRLGKVYPHEPSLRVPLLMRGPGIPAGVTRRDPFTSVDFLPTIAAATGATLERRTDGISLWRVARRGDRGWMPADPDRNVVTRTSPAQHELRRAAVVGGRAKGPPLPHRRPHSALSVRRCRAPARRALRPAARPAPVPEPHRRSSVYRDTGTAAPGIDLGPGLPRRLLQRCAAAAAPTPGRSLVRHHINAARNVATAHSRGEQRFPRLRIEQCVERTIRRTSTAFGGLATSSASVRRRQGTALRCWRGSGSRRGSCAGTAGAAPRRSGSCRPGRSRW